MTTITRRASTKAANPTAWMQDGLCRQVDPDLFFPTGMGAAIRVATANAKRVCNQCPVRSRCLEWSVETGQSTGVWGGLSEDERRQLLRTRAEQRATSLALCLDQQAFIERRVAEGASHRQIGDELGVGHSSVGKAWRFFEQERQANTAAEEVRAA